MTNLSATYSPDPLLPHTNRQVVKTWIAAGLWIGIIVVESTTYLSSEHTSRLLYPLLHFLLGMDLAHFEPIHHFVRKSGHFVGYGTLSFLLFRAWRATLPRPQAWALRWSAIAFFMSAFVASMDEWHQTYLPSRTGRWQDVVLDSCAALAVQVVIALFLIARQRRNMRENSA
jgi:VanZ family protein